MPHQPLLLTENYFPPGFKYEPEFLSVEEERELLKLFRKMEFGKFEMHGQVARRRVRNFGLSYSDLKKTVKLAERMPDFLLELSERIAKLYGKKAENFVQALVTHYPIGAPIGWHSDKKFYKDVAGISLRNPTIMYFRKADNPKHIIKVPLARRSSYLFSGDVRWKWQHHIPPAKQERYSITFRTIGK